ncbi:MAG: thioredoxin domain-containing protein [Longimicrobiales bacterium]|nr:thioredoxin domain-containing protein [Longimicrobiales bacterium]
MSEEVPGVTARMKWFSSTLVALALSTAAPLAPMAPQELENELAGATSPYLRSAADQPVAWQEWGPDAFALARELDRPIWLDIGAIWCHWCHVMDRESYENPELAALINAGFVPIKVDRDERPDIDSRYQLAHQALTGRSGGWPLTMFLTADGTPFAGGTYFPPEQRGETLGVREFATRIGGGYRDRQGEIGEVTAAVMEWIRPVARMTNASGTLTPAVPRAITADVRAAFDPLHGGFGAQPGTKFPKGEAIRLALARGVLDGDPEMVRSALQTLKAYARSGLRDHLLGGFFRYSTNRELTVPHFEKMDYVQAALLQAYLDAYRLTGEVVYAEVARDIMRYVDATMSDPEGGGFYPHQDADLSLDDDGSYFTWSVTQLEAVVTPEEARVLAPHFGVESRGEMREHPDQNVLRVAATPEEIAAETGLSVEEVEERIRSGTRTMRAARLAQEAPFVEKTKYTSRNAMLIVAYLDAWETLGDEHARDFALRTLDLVLETNVQDDWTVHHAHDEGESPVEGTMEDYAFLADALVDAWQVSGRDRYLRAAAGIMDRAEALFRDEEDGGFFDRPPDRQALGLLAERRKDFNDAPLPGTNAVAARVLEKLYLVTSDARWQELAEETLAAFAGTAQASGTFGGSYALAAEMHLNKPPQTVVIGPAGNPLTGELARAAWTTYRPGRIVASYDPGVVALDSLPEAVAGAARVFEGDPVPRAYVCVGRTCAPPTSSPEEVARLVRDFGRDGIR